jgi:plasmid stabilization system protein ParE
LRKFSIKFSAAARVDLEEILLHSKAHFGEALTANLAQDMESSLARMRQFPYACRLRFLRTGKSYRTSIVDPFVIAYTIRQQEIRVFAIFHGARNSESLLNQRI